jgi:hypothetical protein
MRSEKKIVPWVMSKLVGVNKNDVIRVLETIPKDHYQIAAEPSKHYYNPIFTNYIGGFQIDLLQRSNDNHDASYPKYFLVAINVNTKYAYAYPMAHKNAPTMIGVLQQWKDIVEPPNPPPNTPRNLVQITADQEAAWTRSAQVRGWFDANHIKYKFIPSDRHSSLGIVDRFIRTLRDMNAKAPTEGEDESVHAAERQYRDFTIAQMRKLINIHNTSYNTSTRMTPQEMENDVAKQKEYIISKVYEQNRREKISDFNLANGTWVRFMIPRNMMRKRRFQVSPDIAQIIGREGRAYVLQAADGSTKTMNRWRLFPIENVNKRKFKELSTFVNF